MSKKGYRIMVCCLLLMVTGLLYSSTNASSVDPGTIDDPLVTKSYVDDRLDEILNKTGQHSSSSSSKNNNEKTEIDYDKIYKELNKYVDSKLEEVNKVNVYSKYVVVELELGQDLICSDSTEVILRSGNAKIIGNDTGDGISDITIGIDLSQGVLVPKNHLLIIPRDDGRGLKAESKCFIMVKGEYHIVDNESTDKNTDEKTDDTEDNDD